MNSFYYDYVHLEPSEQIGLHEQASWELSHIITGSGMRLIGEQTEAFESGEVVLIPPGVPHCWYFDAKQTDNRGRIANCCIMFEEEQLQRIAEAFPTLQNRLLKLLEAPTTRTFTRTQADAIAEVMKQMNQETAEERAVSVLQVLLLITDEQGISQKISYTKVDSTQIRINQIRTYIICNMKREIRLDSLATHVGMNRSSLCIFIRKHLGQTFSEYLNEFRIETACRLLAEKDIPIKEVGYEVGYNDTSYFNRMFAKLKGCSPREFRGALKSNLS